MINGDIEGDCPESMCHSAGLAQRSLPAQHENSIRGLIYRLYIDVKETRIF